MSEFTAFFSDIDSIAGRTPNFNAHLAVKVSIVGIWQVIYFGVRRIKNTAVRFSTSNGCIFFRLRP